MIEKLCESRFFIYLSILNDWKLTSNLFKWIKIFTIICDSMSSLNITTLIKNKMILDDRNGFSFISIPFPFIFLSLWFFNFFHLFTEVNH